MNLRALILSVTAGIALFALGCSDNNPTNSVPPPENTATTVWNDAGYWETTIDATGSDQFAYYSFSSRDTVDLTDEQAGNSTAWDIGFKRSTVILNGGVSGSGTVAGVDLAAIGNADSTDFIGFNDPLVVGDSDWMSDSYDLLVDDWYSYDPNSHTLNLTDYVYIMKDAAGNYVKFQVVGMEGNGAPPNMGTVSIQYDYAGTSPDFSGTPDTITFDGSGGGPIYVDFSAGAVTNPADPQTSLEWDILFDTYEIHQNNTIFGSGSAGAYAVWGDQTDPTDFAETMSAPTVPQAYFPDQLGSVMTDWYNYDGNTHTLTSKNHVYVIKDGTTYYKLKIVTYYKDISGTPVSGWFTLNWVEM